MDGGQQQRGRIRIRSGLHSGAVVTIAEGEYVIGSGTECDIVLMDPEMAPRHALLRVAGGPVCTAPLDGGVRIDDAPVEADESAQPLGGGEIVTLGPVDLEMDIESLVVTEVEPETFRTRTVAVMIGAARRLPELSRGASSSPLVGRVQERVQALSPRARVAGQAAIATVGLVASAIWIGSLIPTQVAEASAGRVLEREFRQVRAWLSESPGATVSLRGSALHVDGSVGTSRRHGEVQEFLGGLESPVQAKLVVGERIASRAELLLGQLGLAAPDVSYVGDGHYAVRGYGGTKSQWQNRRATLLADLPAIRQLDDAHLATLEDLKAGLARRLAREGLESQIFLTMQDEAIVATGIVGSSDLRRWGDLASRFEHRHAADPSLLSRVHDLRDLLGFAVRSISHGDQPYLTTDDGRRFMQGSVLPGGYVVRSIGKQALTVAKQGEEFTYALGQ